MSVSEYIAPFVGRLVIAWFFFNQAVYYGRSWDATISLMALKNIPVAPLLLALALLLITLGAVALVLGFHTRHGAMVLFTVTVIASVLMHDFWHIKNTVERTADFEIFARNVAICGGLLLLMGVGGGPVAFDNKQQKKKGK